MPPGNKATKRGVTLSPCRRAFLHDCQFLATIDRVVVLATSSLESVNVQGNSVWPIVCRCPAHGSIAAAIVLNGKADTGLNCAVFSILIYLSSDHISYLRLCFKKVHSRNPSDLAFLSMFRFRTSEQVLKRVFFLYPDLRFTSKTS